MITNKSSLWKYVSSLFISIDQFGNAVAGGNPDNTISARVGYYNHYHSFKGSGVPWYWRWFEKVIDTAFWPVDGVGHCHQAYHNDAGEVFDNRTTNFFIGLAAFILIIPSCLLIGLLLYTLYFLGIVKQSSKTPDEKLVKRFRTATLLLKSVNQEIDEFGKGYTAGKVVETEFEEVKGQFNTIATALKL